MKVKCIKIIDEQSGKEIQNSPWLTVNKIYSVLSVLVENKKNLKFQFIGDDGVTPSYHNGNQFKVMSDIIPSNWIIVSEPDSYFELTPRAWARKGFWEDYFEGKSKAISDFESEKEKVIQYDP